MKTTLTAFINSNSRNYFDQKIKLFFGISFFIAIELVPRSTYAIPSYARQTGLSCTACHTVFPRLNAFGRAFKLNGYTLTTIKTINEDLPGKDEDDMKTFLRILGVSPVSAMFQSGYTSLNKTIPGTQNNNIEFPQQFSLFYGGQISPKMGSFIQLTLDNGSGTIGLDNVDIRYANQTTGKTPVTYGFTLNNNPTVQDLWNTTPAWGFPYTTSGIAPTPGASTIVENLGGTVAGLGAYSMIDNLLYLEVSGYRTAQMGASLPPDALISGAVKGTSPYWRAALQHQFGKSYLEIGTFGIATKLYPSGVTGSTDNYTDIALDTQYEYVYDKGQFTLHSSYTKENQKLNASYFNGNAQNLDNNLNKFNIDGSLFFKPNINCTLGYFNTSGSTDTGLYAPAAISGSNLGKPNSSGVRTEIDYLPWANVQLSAQYFAYGKFNGASTNYDGLGRNASDNNMFYLQLWFAF